MEIIQELGHSFIVIDDETRPEFEYMREMLVHNTIPGILECNRVLYNNRKVLKYDITNKKSLSKEYESRLLSFDDIKNLITNLSKIITKSAAYFLEEAMFVIDPDMIYRDIETGDIKILYLPFEGPVDNLIAVAGRFYRFNDFLLEKTDHRDEKAVNLIYRFYKMAKEEFFSIESFSRSIEDNKNNSRDISPIDNLYSERVDLNNIDDFLKEDMDTNEAIHNINRMSNEEDDIDLEKPVSFTGNLILALTSIIFVAVYIFFLRESLYGSYVCLAGIIIALSDAIWLIKNLYRLYENNKNKKIKEVEEPVTVDEYWYDDSKTQFFEDAAYDEKTVMLEEEEASDYAQTRFRWEEDGKKKERIVREYPAIVGKKFDSVDLCIASASVSRRHAKLIHKNEGLFIQDLGSTNGTFVNGKRLLAGEEKKIDNTSEIRFGKVVASVV